MLFRYEPTRSGDIAKELLHDFSGALMVDGYEGYNATCIKNGITRLSYRQQCSGQKFLEKFWTASAGRVATNLMDEVSIMRFVRL